MHSDQSQLQKGIAAHGKAARCPLPGKCLLLQARQSLAGLIAQKNVLCQITLSEDEAVSSALPLLLPDISGLSVLSPAYASLPSGFTSRFNRFPYNGGIPVRVNQICHLYLSSDSFRPDCSQVIASLTLLFPRTARKLSESIAVLEVLSCSSLWLFSIRFYYISKIRFVNRKLERTLFFSDSSAI